MVILENKSLDRYGPNFFIPSVPESLEFIFAMASRFASRIVLRRFSSGGKVLSEEEKAAENVYIKKIEQEKLQKLARKGPQPEDKPTAAGSGGSATDAKPSSSTTSGASTEKVSTDKYQNCAVVVGAVTGLGALGWYLKSRGKKVEVQG